MPRAGFNIGLKRIHSNRSAAIGSATKDVRAQFRAIQSNLQKVIDAIEGATPEALRAALEPTLQKSLEICPKDTGKLRESAYLVVRQTSKGAEAEIGYGRAGKPIYAIIVHEDLNAYHQPPTRAKFLQGPVNEDLPEIENRIRDFMEGFFG